MNEPRREAGFWPDKLTSLAGLLKVDALAVVLAMRDGSALTYVQHNLAAPEGWESYSSPCLCPGREW